MDASGQCDNCAFKEQCPTCRHYSFLQLPRTSIRMSWKSADALYTLTLPTAEEKQSEDGFSVLDTGH